MRPPPKRASSREDRAPNPVAVRLFDAALGFLLRPRARRVRRWSFLVTVPLGFFAGRSLGLDLGDGVLKMWRHDPEFAQRYSATIDHDGFEGQWQLARTPGDWQDDLRVVYRRVL